MIHANQVRFWAVGLVWGLGILAAQLAFGEQAVIRRSQLLMGTLVEVTAVAQDNAMAQQAAVSALSEIRRLEQLLSTWISTSDLSRLNAAAGRHPVKVSPETMG